MASIQTVAAEAESRLPGCELCAIAAGRAAAGLVMNTPRLRVVRVLDMPAFPAFYRVIWHAHVAEWTDLGPADRSFCLEAVARVEQVLRTALTPRKINLASFGNVVPHLHWHVVARFEWDTHFPQPLWGMAQRAEDETRLAGVRERLALVDYNVAAAMADLA